MSKKKQQKPKSSDSNREGAFRKLMAAARKSIAKMDEADGCRAPDRPLDSALRTIMTALQDCLCNNYKPSGAEAIVMLSQIELRARPAAEQAKGEYTKDW